MNLSFDEKKLLEELKKVKQEGFPNYGVLYKDGKLVLVKWNIKSSKKVIEKGRHLAHSEFLLKDDIANLSGEILVVQTLFPCSFCWAELEKLKKPIMIYYLFDPHQKFEERSYFKDSKYITVKRISPNHNLLIETSWEIYKKKMEKKQHRRSKKNIEKKWNGNFNLIKLGSK